MGDSPRIVLGHLPQVRPLCHGASCPMVRYECPCVASLLSFVRGSSRCALCCIVRGAAFCSAKKCTKLSFLGTPDKPTEGRRGRQAGTNGDEQRRIDTVVWSMCPHFRYENGDTWGKPPCQSFVVRIHLSPLWVPKRGHMGQTTVSILRCSDTFVPTWGGGQGDACAPKRGHMGQTTVSILRCSDAFVPTSGTQAGTQGANHRTNPSLFRAMCPRFGT